MVSKMTFNPCCCISSKTGATIIGVLQLIVSILGILYAGFSYVGTRYIEDLEDPVVKEHFMQELRIGFKGHPYLESADEKTIFSILYIVQAGMLVGCIISLILVSFLIHGLRKERLRFIQVYLIVSGICLALSVVAALANDTVFAMSGSFAGLFGFVLNAYFLTVIYAAYVEIRNKLLQDQNPAVKYEKA
ncbi:hypothetical protein Ocin01_11213 [Orchesella cincta]|uniref:Uncharacterized protein n=1 Tax=Orchesella cincta TaxID=48709 RepID=A0A1D2MR44_ORCCI|nr:hypothetical protein Ocin01_11213 [Orchesella cincta]